MPSTWIENVNARRVGALVGTTLSLIAIVAVAGHRFGHTSATAPTPENIPSNLCQVGADPSWWQAVTDDLGRAEYAPTPTASGFQAPNRAQNLRTTFAERGIEVVPRTSKDVAPAWQFGWATRGFGRADRMEDVGPASPETNGARVTYRRDGWSEWYENSPKGLEQGFTIERRPEGEGPVRIAGDFPSVLHAQAREDGAIDFIDEHGACVIRYGELHVWDAQGTELPAELEVAGTTLGIAIDDRSADYPLVVDPLMTSPAWTAESNQTNAIMGFSVGTAGDVNGDGFSDVVVGAWLYDNGSTDEGRAFVYHGSAGGLSVTPNWIAESDQAIAHYGYSVATAGDVNGDGYDDVIVGAFRYDNGSPEEGRAFVYHGSASGLSLTANWTAEGNQSNAEFATSVATAGDVNNDGFSDIVVGSPFFDNGQSNEGQAFVYHGSAGGLSLTSNWSAEGNQVGVQLGLSVATAGDVNADGFSDVMVGSWVYTNGEANEGRAFVYHGSAGGLSPTSNWSAEGNQANAAFGVSVAGAGDVNGDGFADVIVGAQGFTNGQSAEGRAFVYHGSTMGLAATAAWTAESNLNDTAFGHAVATAGDVNGDGFADVIVGALNFSNGQATEGRTYAYQGSRFGLATTPVWITESNQVGANFGISVGTAGDVNGDGFSDVIVGAWGFDNGQTDEGRAFVYLGSAAGPATTAAWITESDRTGAQFGISVATAGDVNGDGFSDVIVGAHFYDNGQTQEGRAFLYLGSASGLSTTAAWTAESNQVQALFGYSVATAGDVNGDGFSDVIVGADRYDNPQSAEGRAFLYLGSPSGLSSTAAWTAESDQANSQFGISVATAGDVNGDGFSDVIVGAYLFDNGQTDEGRAYAYMGSAVGLSPTPAWIVEPDQAGARFGWSAATAGDVNGDGFSDVIVGAWTYDNGQAEEGGAFVYLGSASGLSTTADWIAEADQAGALFGISTATAGDVNGDGYSDVIVGAYGYDNGQNAEGRAFVYQGSPAGLSPTATWTAESDQFDGWLGYSVSTAGDVNGDGFSDVIVGAYHYDNGQDNEGRALAYLGSAAGLAPTAAWTAESDQAHATFGVSTATAGDVNGDGFSDILVGANFYDNGLTDEGRAFLYYGNGGPGRTTRLRQHRTDGVTPIAHLGQSDSDSQFRIRATMPSVYGRTRLQIEHEVKPLGVHFDGLGTVTGGYVDVGGEGEIEIDRLVSALPPGTIYHWRVRARYDRVKTPFQCHGPWMHIPVNGWNESDLRTAAGTAGVDIAAAPPALLRLEAPRPNPMRAHGEIAYTLAEAGTVRLTVVDVAGRVRAVLAGGSQAAGRHSTRWDGRDRERRALPAGVYLVRLEVGNQVMSQKLVIAH